MPTTISALRRCSIGLGANVQLNPLRWRIGFEREHYNAADFRIVVEFGPIALEVYVDC